MSRNGKVIVALSGGVDSSVAAALLRDAGYDCLGVFLRVGAHEAAEPTHTTSQTRDNCSLSDGLPRRLKHGCCSASDAIDARSIAARLDIPFYALNFERDFERIIDYFVDTYAAGRTPNPCVMCNIQIKFGTLLRYADMMDAEFVATGHYARILPGNQHDGYGSGPRLARSLNAAKDQSYVLFGIRRADLGRCLFPLGEMTDKATVRAIAADLGLRVHDKPDSQEICFVPDHDYRRLVRERRPETARAGRVIDRDGNVLGTHDGIAAYTIGQRRGLGIAAGEPIYVTRLNVIDNTVIVGPREDLLASGLIAEQINWLIDPPAGAARGQIKIRHMHPPAAGAFAARSDGCVEARFDTPQMAVTPGQAAVFYDGDTVCAGGWIRTASAAESEQETESGK